MNNFNNTINCKGLNCPIPVLNTKKYFDGIESGKGVIIVDNEVAKNNIVKFAQGNGFGYEVENQEENLFYITVIKGESINSNLEIEDININNSMPLTIVVGSDKLGSGDNELGIALMKSYLFALSEADVIPKNLLFLNSGVKLVVTDSLTLDSINNLMDRGVNVQSCGLCLDFYGLKEELQVGDITNMYAIIEMMNKSNTIVL